MYSGNELKMKLNEVCSLLRQYDANIERFCQEERKLRNDVIEKKKIDVSGKKGKVKLTGMVILAYVLVMLLLATIIYGMWSVWIALFIIAAVAYAMKDKHIIIAGIAGLLFLCLLGYTVYGSVIAPFIRGIQQGNVPGIAMTVGMAVILLVIVLVINSKYVDLANIEIRKLNKQIRKENEETYREIHRLEKQAKEIDEKLKREIYDGNVGWYPADYTNVEAAEFFCKEIVKHPEEGMSQLIDRWENELRRRVDLGLKQQMVNNQIIQIQNQRIMQQQFDQIISNQNRTNQQLCFSNMIGMFNCYQLSLVNGNLNAIRNGY